MPIGVPRIIYCWGEELPAQWTDIYNFIFRRRMVFLMQYLDDELCNQICGLLINIHMEDRSKELEKKEMERSGVFKSSSRASDTQETKKTKKGNDDLSPQGQLNSTKSLGETSTSFHKKQSRSFEDLLNADEDLGIDDIDTLEQNTLQKITTEWLNWNAQFFDYSDEPYIFYLAELLSKDFNNNEAKNSLFYRIDGAKAPLQVQKISKLLQILKISKKVGTYGSSGDSIKSTFVSSSPSTFGARQEVAARLGKPQLVNRDNTSAASLLGNVYSPFRTYVTFELENYNLRNLISLSGFQKLLQKLEQAHVKNARVALASARSATQALAPTALEKVSKLGNVVSTVLASKGANERTEGARDAFIKKNKVIYKFLSNFIQKNVTNKLFSLQQFSKYSAKALGQRHLRREYGLEHNLSILLTQSLASLSASAYGARDSMAKPLFASSTAVHQKAQAQGNTKTELKNRDKGTFIDKPHVLPRVCNPSAYIKSFPQTLSGNDSLKVGFAKARHDILKSFSYLDSSMSLNDSAYPALEARANLQKPFNQSFSASTYGASSAKDSLGPDKNSYSDRAITRDFYRKQTERALIDEESKKVFVIINSFGGSVGNGITIHDALQFIKAGSLTLGLGVAASAASLALAGGTIGERYVTEGCHVMIHQPEGGLQGQASDIWIDSQEIMKIRLDVAEIYSLATYRPRHKILRDLDRDFYLTAMETIYYGLADEIATNEVMHSIIEMTSKVWDFQDSKQQRLLEARESASGGMDTQTQN